MSRAYDKTTTECPRSEVLDAWVARTLSDEESETLERHYFSCDTCWREIERLVEVKAALIEDGESTPAELMHRRFPWASVAAALVFLVALGIWQSWRPGLAPERTLRGEGDMLEPSVSADRDGVTVSWRSLRGATTYRVEAFDPEGRLLYQSETPGSPIHVSRRELPDDVSVIFLKLQALDELRRSVGGSELVRVALSEYR